MSIYQLTSQNFNISGFQKKTLNIGLPGGVLIFFRSKNCRGCQAFEPIFYELARIETSINYGMIDIDIYRDVVDMSRQTNTVISSTPFIVLYVDGRPAAIFRGKKNIPAMRSFILKALSERPPQSFPQDQSSFVHNASSNPSQPPRGGGMYGSGGYSHPAIAPRQGQAGYSQARNSGEKYYAPEIDKGPNMRGVLKGDQISQYAHLNDIDEEDEEKMLIPKQVTPHNVPWESTYKKIETVD